MILVSKEVLSRCRKRLATITSVQKSNPCHEPAGSPKGGQFCSTGGLSPLISKSLEGFNGWLLQRQKKSNTESAVVFGEDGEPIFSQQGQSNHVSFNGEQVAKMKGGYLTHNHPGVRWPGLSDGDLVMASQAGLKGVFACTEDGSLFGAKVPSSSELPGVIPDIRSATEFIRSLTQYMAENALKKRLGVANLGHEFWTNRNELGAAQSYLINAVLHDMGLITLTVSKWGTTLEKADRMLGGLDKIRQEIKDGIANPPKVPKNSDPEVNLASLRLDQLHSIARGVQRRREAAEDYATVLKYNKCHQPAGSPKGGQFCSANDAGQISSADINKAQKQLKDFQDLFGTSGGYNTDGDEDGSKAKIRVQKLLVQKFMNDPEGLNLYKDAMKEHHGIVFTNIDDVYESIVKLVDNKFNVPVHLLQGGELDRKNQLTNTILKAISEVYGLADEQALPFAKELVRHGYESLYMPEQFKSLFHNLTLLADTDSLGGSEGRLAGDLAKRMHSMMEDGGKSVENRFWERSLNQSVYGWVHQWAQSSGDNNPGSIAMQLAVALEFDTGVSSVKYLIGKGAAYKQAREMYDTWGKVYQKFVRYQYEATQEFFKKHGITEVYLFRGVGLPQEALGKPLKTTSFTKFGRGQYISNDSGIPKLYPYSVGTVKVGSAEFDMQPASSFAYSSFVASSFTPAIPISPGTPVNAKLDRSGVVLITKVPADRILSTSETGWGCKAEEEMVVLGGKLQANYVAWNRTYGEYDNDMLYKMSAQLLPEYQQLVITSDAVKVSSNYRDAISLNMVENWNNKNLNFNESSPQIERLQPAMVVYNGVVSGQYDEFRESLPAIASRLEAAAEAYRVQSVEDMWKKWRS